MHPISNPPRSMGVNGPERAAFQIGNGRRAWYLPLGLQHEVLVPSTVEIIRDAESLPVEERALIVDTLLRTLNPPDPEIDRKWAAVARRRLDELRSGKVQPVPGDEVFAKIQQRFGA